MRVSESCFVSLLKTTSQREFAPFPTSVNSSYFDVKKKNKIASAKFLFPNIYSPEAIFYGHSVFLNPISKALRNFSLKLNWANRRYVLALWL